VGSTPTYLFLCGVLIGSGQPSHQYNIIGGGGKNLGKNFFYGLEKMSYLWSGGWVSLDDVVFKGKNLLFVYVFLFTFV
jgi:hypothetical protein